MKKEVVNRDERVTDLLLAIQQKNEDEIEKLLKFGIDVNAIYEDGFLRKSIYGPALELALHEEVEYYDIVPMLLSYGANPKMLSKNTINRLVKENEINIIDELIKAGLQIIRDTKNEFGDKSEENYDILLAALSEENSELVEIILSNGFDLTVYEEAGYIPLVARGVVLKSPEFTELILNYSGYDLNKPFRNDNRTLLVEALKDNLIDTALLLLEKGADPNITDKIGFSPLYLAVRSKNTKVARVLLEKGADPYFIYNGQTLIGLAAANADYKMLELFKEFKVDLNASLPGRQKPIELVPNYDQFMTFMVLYQNK